MATIAIKNRQDLFPVDTPITIWPPAAQRDGKEPAGSAPIAYGTVSASSDVVVASPAIVNNVVYVAYGFVGGQHRYLRVTSKETVHVAPLKWRQKVAARRDAMGSPLPGANYGP